MQPLVSETGWASVGRSLTLARFDFLGALRSRWVLFVGAVDLALFAVFVWLGLRESAILGFTGISRVVLNVINVTLLAVPIVVLVATSQSIVAAKSSGLLEFLLSQPVRRGEWFAGLSAARASIVLGPLLLLLLSALVYGAVSEGETAALAIMLARSFAVVAALVVAFLGLGLLISVRAPSEERAVVYALLAWLVASALHDFALIGLLLQVRVPPELVFLLAAANPVEAARVALLASSDAQLSILGPVGFWIANRLGASAALALGIAWPTLFGLVCAFAARRAVLKGDAVI